MTTGTVPLVMMEEASSCTQRPFSSITGTFGPQDQQVLRVNRWLGSTDIPVGESDPSISSALSNILWFAPESSQRRARSREKVGLPLNRRDHPWIQPGLRQQLSEARMAGLSVQKWGLSCVHADAMETTSRWLFGE